MSMIVQDAEGKDITVYTEDEIQAKDAAVAAKDAEIATKQGELDRLSKIQAEQAGNFKKLKDMTEEEKSKLSADQIAERTRADKLEGELEALKGSIDADKLAAADAAKEAIITRYCGSDKELREKFEKNMGILSIENLEEKAAAAASLSGLTRGQRMDPLHAPIMNGDAPGHKKEADEKKEFLESDKAKAALAAMGDAPKA